MTHPYLKNKIVSIESIANPEKWKEHFSKFANDDLGRDVIAFNMNNVKSRPYSFPNTEKQFCAPLAAQGVKQTLDNMTKHKCPDFQDQELTEQEYFEKKLNKNLNPYLDIENNWWADINKNKAGFPTIKDGKIRLDLSKPVEMIQYRIFEEHYRDEVAFSMAEFKANRLNTYLYLVTDNSVEDTATVTTGKLIMEAAIKCAEVSEDKESIIKFFACLGKSVDPKQSLAGLQKPLFALMQDNPKAFLENAKDPLADFKYLIHKGRKVGLITYNPKSDLYTLPSGTLGKLNDVIDHLKQIKNQEEYLQLQIDVDQKYVV